MSICNWAAASPGRPALRSLAGSDQFVIRLQCLCNRKTIPPERGQQAVCPGLTLHAVIPFCCWAASILQQPYRSTKALPVTPALPPSAKCRSRARQRPRTLAIARLIRLVADFAPLGDIKRAEQPPAVAAARLQLRRPIRGK